MGRALANSRTAYDDDFAAWADDQARLLRAGDLSALDVEHIAEEIEGLGANQKHALKSRLARLLHHLLKWEHQAARRSLSWQITIRSQRSEIVDLLDESPSLRSTLSATLPKSYRLGRGWAIEETGFLGVPETCPWSVDQVMSPEFLPD